jgi:hypothetical protein
MYELHTSCNKSEYVTVNVDYERYSSNDVGGRQLPVQSVPVTIKVVSSNPIHGKVY